MIFCEINLAGIINQANQISVMHLMANLEEESLLILLSITALNFLNQNYCKTRNVLLNQYLTLIV